MDDASKRADSSTHERSHHNAYHHNKDSQNPSDEHKERSHDANNGHGSQVKREVGVDAFRMSARNRPNL